MTTKKDLLKHEIQHLSLATFDPVGLVDAMEHMAFQARNTARAAKIYEMMLRDEECSVWLCLAGSLISAGLKKVIVELLESNMVDVIVSTGANIVDQDFFEAIGFRHYVGDAFADDEKLREQAIDRIYDTYVDEEELKICDQTMAQITASLPPQPYSSREFIREMGRYLEENHPDAESIVSIAYQRDVPIFCPAFSDCSAGFGLIKQQWEAGLAGEPVVSIDSAKDFLELTRIKIEGGDSGLVMIGGGVPKNFAQDTVVAAEMVGHQVSMHKYAVQITVANEHDGALSGSTLKEACSWGKVSMAHEQMVYGEATVVFPLVAGYAWHKKAGKDRKTRSFSRVLETGPIAG